MTKIFAYLGKHTLGDFLTEALYVCAVRELFDAAELTVCYVDNRPHKADIVNCIWNAKTVIKKEFVEGLLPVQAFEAQARNLLDLDPELRASGGLDADLILTGAMFQEAYLNGLPLPALMPKGSALGHQMGDIHQLAAWALLGVIGLHVLGALYHQFVARDRTLARML